MESNESNNIIRNRNPEINVQSVNTNVYSHNIDSLNGNSNGSSVNDP